MSSLTNALVVILKKTPLYHLFVFLPQAVLLTDLLIEAKSDKCTLATATQTLDKIDQ